MMDGQGRCLPLVGPAAGVYAELARPGPEDQPAGSGLGILKERPTQHIAQERSGRRRVLRVEQGMKRSDHLMRIWPIARSAEEERSETLAASLPEPTGKVNDRACVSLRSLRSRT